MDSESSSPLHIVVEGNIGAGKSTLLRLMDSHLTSKNVLEPHHLWQDVGGHNLLDVFYKDSKRWAYTFQTYAFVSRVITAKAVSRQNPHDAYILERSVYSDRYCFARLQHEIGTMDDLEWSLYKKWWQWFIPEYAPVPQAFIYLRVSPEMCYERIKRRQRSEEGGIAFEYIQKLHTAHEQWLIEKRDIIEQLLDIPVLILDGDKEFENDMQYQQSMMQKITAFCATNNIKNIHPKRKGSPWMQI